LARSGIRDTAYVLHFLAAAIVGVLPVLGFLQNTGLLSHDSVQALGMIFVLGYWIPAVILLLVALLLSFCVRPPDYALWLMAALLLTIVGGVFLEFQEPVLDALLGMYVLASLGFGIRWIVKAGRWPSQFGA
jgi:hypothetical protein